MAKRDQELGPDVVAQRKKEEQERLERVEKEKEMMEAKKKTEMMEVREAEVRKRQGKRKMLGVRATTTSQPEITQEPKVIMKRKVIAPSRPTTPHEKKKAKIANPTIAIPRIATPKIALTPKDVSDGEDEEEIEDDEDNEDDEAADDDSDPNEGEEKKESSKTAEEEMMAEEYETFVTKFLTVNSGIRCTQLFDVSMAKYLVDLAGYQIDKLSRKVVKRMLSDKKKGNEFDVLYVRSKNSVLDNLGRLTPDPYYGLSALPRDFRSALAKPFYFDVDIENCHPTILLAEAQQRKWPHVYLKQYCKNREKIFAQMMAEDTNLDRNQCKTMFIRVLFGGKPEETDPRFVQAFGREMASLQKNIAALHPQIFKHCQKKAKAKNKTWSNVEGACCALYLQTREVHALLTLKEFLQRKGRQMDVLIHDGGFVRKLKNKETGEYDEKVFPEELLREGEEAIEKVTGLPLKLAVKAIETSFEVPSKKEDVKEGRSYSDVKAAFEKRYFLCISAHKFYDMWTDEYVTLNELRTTYYDKTYEVTNKDGELVTLPFLRQWLADEDKVKYEKVVFIVPPNKPAQDENAYNTWKGLAVERLPKVDVIDEDTAKKLDGILRQFLRICESQEHFEYVMDMIAAKLVNPGERSNVSVLFHSMPGIGKNIILLFLMHLIGEEYCVETADPEIILGPFNEKLRRAILVIVNEMEKSVSDKRQKDIKDLITADTRIINGKFQKHTTVPNYVLLFMTTNKTADRCMKLEVKERRFHATSSPSGPLTAPEIKILLADRKDPKVQRAFYDMMCRRFDERKVDEKDWVYSRPYSQYLEDMQNTSLPLELQFMIDYVGSLIEAKEREGKKSAPKFIGGSIGNKGAARWSKQGTWLISAEELIQIYQTARQLTLPVKKKEFNIRIHSHKIGGVSKKETTAEWRHGFEFNIEDCKKFMTQRGYMASYEIVPIELGDIASNAPDSHRVQ